MISNSTIRPLERLYFDFDILFIAAFFFCFSGDLNSDLNILLIATFFFFCLYTFARGPI